MEPDEVGRSARKRRAIMDAATTLFLRNGYQGTSMDEVAAQAAVSKQTVYKNFADKERLFSEIVQGITGNAEPFLRELAQLLEGDDVEAGLTEVARRHIAAVMQPDVLRLRRLVIAEAGRFPDLARIYHEQAPTRVIRELAVGLRGLAARGLLRIEDADTAAEHLAFLVLGQALDRAMFRVTDKPYTRAELNRFADAGVHTFLAAYGKRTVD